MLFLAGCGFAAAAVLALTNRRVRHLRRRVHSLEALTQRRASTAQEVAHEVKNPITAIICSAEALEHLLRKKVSEDELRCLRYIREYADVVLRHLTNYLDLNLADSGSLVTEPRTIHPLEIARGVAGLLQSAAMRKSIEITVHGDERCAVCADPRHLRQCLFNLIHNALKFSGHGQEIGVCCAVDEMGMVRIDIRDHGVGMTPGQLEALWRGNRRQLRGKGDGAGAGLGLQITKKLIELSGGRLSVVSRSGEGSCFTLELSASPSMADLEDQGSMNMIHGQPLHGQSVLLLEPHDGAAGSVGSLVEALGGIVARVSEATEAVEAMEIGEFQTVVIDSDLGLEEVRRLATRFRNNVDGKSPRVVIAGTDLKLEGTEKLNKPFDGRSLVETILGDNREIAKKEGEGEAPAEL